MNILQTLLKPSLKPYHMTSVTLVKRLNWRISRQISYNMQTLEEVIPDKWKPRGWENCHKEPDKSSHQKLRYWSSTHISPFTDLFVLALTNVEPATLTSDWKNGQSRLDRHQLFAAWANKGRFPNCQCIILHWKFFHLFLSLIMGYELLP